MADNTAATTASRDGAKHRSAKVGQVTSRSGNKTIVVEVTRRVQHPLYKRFVNKTKKFYAHDEQNQSQVGDRVRIVETRPLSRLKRWRLVQIVHRSALGELKRTAEVTPEQPEQESGS
ncbi:MAG: 30S ribosomal protein S17 [Acidobacteria bacterium]|nr:30S ribosomal protein S17 [Acidobacteriota bacterium]